MIEADLREANAELSQLVEAAERGERVLLKREGVAVAGIVPLKKATFSFGFLKDQVGDVPDSLLFSTQNDDFDEFTKL
jgi:antitoxin (DNA-binding transcriptional repressor) of toxin-antitoxin stability system